MRHIVGHLIGQAKMRPHKVPNKLYQPFPGVFEGSTRALFSDIYRKFRSLPTGQSHELICGLDRRKANKRSRAQRGGGTAFSTYHQLNVWLTSTFWCDLPGFCAAFVRFLAANGSRSVAEQGVTGNAAEGCRGSQLHLQYPPARGNSTQWGHDAVNGWPRAGMGLSSSGFLQIHAIALDLTTVPFLSSRLSLYFAHRFVRNCSETSLGAHDRQFRTSVQADKVRSSPWPNPYR